LVYNEGHKSIGLHVFGNNLTEERACAIALNNGKQKFLEDVFPQGVQSEAILK